MTQRALEHPPAVPARNATQRAHALAVVVVAPSAGVRLAIPPYCGAVVGDGGHRVVITAAVRHLWLDLRFIRAFRIHTASVSFVVEGVRDGEGSRLPSRGSDPFVLILGAWLGRSQSSFQQL